MSAARDGPTGGASPRVDRRSPAAPATATRGGDRRRARSAARFAPAACVVGVLERRRDRARPAPRRRHARRAARRRRSASASPRSAARPPSRRRQRLLRHVARLAALEDARRHRAQGVVAAALDVVALDSGVARCAAASDGALDARVRASGPLAGAIAATPPAGLAVLADAVRDATSSFTLGSTRDEAPAPLAALRGQGAEALVAVGLVAHGERRGHAAARRVDARVDVPRPTSSSCSSCSPPQRPALLRTADLVRSLRERAATDPLTGLGHHATFHEALAGSHRRPSTAVVRLRHRRLQAPQRHLRPPARRPRPARAWPPR